MLRSAAYVVPACSHKPVYLRLTSTVAICYLIYYIWWRIAYSLNPQAPFFSWVLVLAEAFGVASYLLFAWMTRDVSPTRAFIPAPPGLNVDILVPTYDESMDILEATLVGCNHVRYPHRTYLLDDGRRPEARELAERLHCGYLTRPTNEHAKAGNLNAALANIDGEFVVVLDADVVPQRDLLERTLGYFEDPRLAFVQLPQEFYNQDSIQHHRRGPVWHEQSLFFRIIQPGKNHSNSGFWCGSPSVIRRAALDDVGGVATGTITEDIHTSVRWHSRGWHSFYLSEPLAFGIAPQTIRAFLVQRLRWASGTMQLYSSRESPLWIRGLSLKQRLSYFASFLAYFESFQKFFLLMTPVAIIMLGVFPMRVDLWNFALHWAPYFAINIIANTAGGRGQFRYFQTEKYNLLKMVVFLQSTLTLFTRKPLKFKVTPKSVGPGTHELEVRAVSVFLLIYGILTCTVLVGLMKFNNWGNARVSVGALSISIVWALYNAFTVLGGLSDVLARKHERKHYRFLVDLEAQLVSAAPDLPARTVRIRDISLTGVGFVAPAAAIHATAPAMITFCLPSRQRIAMLLNAVHTGPANRNGDVLFGASFVGQSALDRLRLQEFLFVDMPEQWRQVGRPDLVHLVAESEAPTAVAAWAARVLVARRASPSPVRAAPQLVRHPIELVTPVRVTRDPDRRSVN